MAGLFYMQEPSAMAPVEALSPRPGDVVLDVAAAPGGKTTQLSAAVGVSGLVVANDVSRSRVRSLEENLDRWGATNTVVTSMPADRIREMGRTFDCVMLDAPCSGEALFRRDPAAVQQWSTAVVKGCARRQARLLVDAGPLVAPGGSMVYSTCSFSVAENEAQVAQWLDTARSNGWALDNVSSLPGASPGLAVPGTPTDRTARYWPHLVEGDGQFLARMRNMGSGGAKHGRPHDIGGAGGSSRRPTNEAKHHDHDKVVSAWTQFATDVGLADLAPQLVDHTRFVVRSNRIWLLPASALGLPTEFMVRPGLPLGRLRPGRFEPHHGLATVLEASSIPHVSWEQTDPRLDAYLRGETIKSPGEPGWVLVCYHRWGMGWARRTQGTLKNFFPRALRWQGRQSPRIGG